MIYVLIGIAIIIGSFVGLILMERREAKKRLELYGPPNLVSRRPL